jgi:hypothetical protein
LDTVKVVRNDLSEADLEVVRAQKGPVAPVGPVVAPVASAGPKKAARATALLWGRITSRLFGAGAAVRYPAYGWCQRLFTSR